MRSPLTDGCPGQELPLQGSLCNLPLVELVSNAQIISSCPSFQGPVPKKLRAGFPSQVATTEGTGFSAATLTLRSGSPLVTFVHAANARLASMRAKMMHRRQNCWAAGAGSGEFIISNSRGWGGGVLACFGRLRPAFGEQPEARTCGERLPFATTRIPQTKMFSPSY